METNLEKIKSFLQRCGVSDMTAFMDECLVLKDILLAENKKYNLTRIREDSEYWNKHIADSLSIAQFFPELREKHLKLADIGCGAGFPSLVLAIAFKNLEVTAIDSIQKKTNFVKLAATQLRLRNVNVIWGRARELKITGAYDYITARAVAEPIKIFKESRKLINDNGKIVIYQTPSTDGKSLEILNKLTKMYSVTWNQTSDFTLPDGNQRKFIYSSRN